MKTYTKYFMFTFFKSLLFVFSIMLSLVFILNLLSELDFFKEIDTEIYFPLFLALLKMRSGVILKEVISHFK